MDTLSASNSELLVGHVDRRREPRDGANIRARLKSLDPVTSTGPSTVVQVVEISRHGLKMFVTRPYLPNSLVQLTMFHEVINGKVRHCTAVHGGFHVGIQTAKLGF
jgi:PilZ domain